MADITQTKNEGALLKKVWDIANVLAAAGVGFTDYITQLTYILFLKMDSEKEELGLGSSIPEGYKWDDLVDLNGTDLVDKYEEILKELSKDTGLIGTIFTKASNKIDRPVMLAKVIEMVNGENWYMMEGDFKGAIYESILEKNGQDKKSGAGQYFTPRALIKAIVDVVDPKITETVADPACGTGGFLLAAFEHMKPQSREIEKQNFLKNRAFFGADNTPLVVTLASMNLYLHDIGTAKSPIVCQDSLIDKSDKMYDVILANPPFNVDKVKAESCENAGRLPFGMPGVNKNKEVGNGNYLWISYFYSYLNERGRAGFVMASSATDSQGKDKDIRESLIKTGNVDVMISVGNNFFYTKSLPCSLWFFDKAKGEAIKDKVLFIDARNYYTVVDRTLNEWSEWQLKNMNAIVWLYRGETEKYTALVGEYRAALGSDQPFAEQVHALSEKAKALRAEAKKAVEAADKKDKKKTQAEYDEKLAELADILTVAKEANWLYEKFGDGVYADILGLCKVADLSEIECKGWSLTPGAYVGVAPVEDDGVDFEERMAEIHRELLSLQAESNDLMDTISANMKEMGL